MVSSEELFFSLEAATIRFPNLEIADLDVCSTSLCKFQSDRRNIIRHHSIGLSWCHVLPSMKKGKVMSISHDIPEDCPFKAYKDIKRHWKNTYGYRLPENEDDVLYYQVHFKPLGNTYYTYPDVCLRARDIQKVPRVDPKPILMTFLKDLLAKLPKVCGTHLKLQPKATYPTIGLKESGIVQNEEAMNLTTKNPSGKKVIYRSKQEMQYFYNKQPETPSKHIIKPSPGMAPRSMDLYHFKIVDSYASNTEQMRNNFISNANIPLSLKHQTRDVQDTVNDGECEGVIPSSQQPGSRFVPFFKARKKDMTVYNQPTNVPNTKVIPSFPAKSKIITPIQTDSTRVSGQVSYRDSTHSTASISRGDNHSPVLDFTFQTPISIDQSQNTVDHHTTKPVFKHRQTDPFPHGMSRSDSGSRTWPISPHPQINTPTTPQLKRKTLENANDGGSTPKKCRTKPQVQENVDVDQLARCKQLHRVNTVTLIAWLKDKGVICKSKDKKTDIMEKVLRFLKVTDHEQ